MTLNRQNVLLSAVLDDIERQTDYLFIFNNEVNINRRVSVKAKNQPVSGVLDKLLATTDVEYAMAGTHIVLSRKEALFSESVRQSGKRITGTVVDETGEPVIGANIIEKGAAANGTVTDADGNFSLDVADNAVLQISFIGYITQEIGGLYSGKHLIINLIEDMQALEEVVVVGYGTIKKRDLTGAVAQFKTDKIEKEKPATVQDILRANLPGLNVSVNTDAKGGGGMLIRGQRSLKAGNSPLLVVDGMIFFGELSEINPADIDRVDVLKDAASAAVYGAKSANGVVIITTKKGVTQKPIIHFDASVGVATPGPATVTHPGTEEFLKFRENSYNSWSLFQTPWAYAKPTSENLSKYGKTLDEWLAFDGKKGDPEDIWLQRINVYDVERKSYFNGKSFDWNDATYRNGLRRNYNVSLSGMSNRFNYYWSMDYTDNEGVLIGDEYEAFRTNLKFDASVTDWLTVGTNINFQNRIEEGLPVDWFGQIYRNSPYALPTDDDGNLVSHPAPNQESVNTAFYNQYKELHNRTYTFNTSMYAKLTLPYNFTYQATFAPRFSWLHRRYHESSENPMWGDNGMAQRATTQWYEWQLDQVLTWDKTYADRHHFIVTLMQGSEEHRSWYESITARDFSPTDALGYHFLAGANMAKSSVGSSDSHSTGDAMMGRLFYAFDNRYMLTASIRRDGYSAFGMAHPHATFPSISLAWDFSRESFFKWKPMNSGKLRLSWGQNGNRDIGIYQALSNLTTGSGKYLYVDPASGTVREVSQLYADRMANHNLRWETTSSWNVGLDFGFLANRITGAIDAYSMPTTNLLMDQSLPIIIGYSKVTTNLGEMLNRGMEISLNSINVNNRDFSWSSTLNFVMNRNKIVHLYYEYEDVTDANGNVIGRKERDDVSNQWFIGYDINSIWTYNVIGIWQLGEEEEAAKYGLYPGDMKLKDVDGDLRYTNDDKEFLGYTTPRFRLSLRNEFTMFQNWDISLSAYSWLGQKGRTVGPGNYTLSSGSVQVYYDKYTRAVGTKFWTPDNPTNDYARLMSTNPQNVYPDFVLNKSFVRLENIAVAYNVPKRFLSKLNIEKLSIYGNIRNVAVWAPYWKLEYGDPEGAATYNPRYYTMGINVTL
ncbi:MAG: SusC/RagA family TonB-linked outer membrane protein [Tannerella sp.]|nr:SusC/RagA family TonB-linked outer membrane protein [Tannerella sp.]